MDNTETFLAALRALQHTLQSGADQIGVILELAQRSPEEQEAARAAGCPHPLPKRVPNPAMGHPTRFFCQQCKQDVEG